MNRGTRTLIKFLTIILVTVICTLLTYYISSYAAGHSLANASGNMNYSLWQDKFFTLTSITGGLIGLCSLSWFLMARGIFKINSAKGVGKRITWAIIALIALIISIAVPQIYSTSIGIKINGIVVALFIILFVGLNYWLLSIFTTPSAFKYTPFGAQFFLSRFGK